MEKTHTPDGEQPSCSRVKRPEKTQVPDGEQPSCSRAKRPVKTLTLDGEQPSCSRAKRPAPLNHPPVTPFEPITNTLNRSTALPPEYFRPAASPGGVFIQQTDQPIPTRTATSSTNIIIDRESTFQTHIQINVHKRPINIIIGSSPSELDTAPSTSSQRQFVGVIKRIPVTPDRINLSDMSTPQTPPSKKSCLDKTKCEFNGCLDSGLKGLSLTQVVDMISKITNKHPKIEEEIRREMPKPDLSQIAKDLRYVKDNILRCLPQCPMMSKTDSRSYNRAVYHLIYFKRCVVAKGEALVKSQHWESVVQYVFLAWSYAKATPVWDDQPHNIPRKHCFEALTSFCMTALREGSFSKKILVEIQDRLQSMVADSDKVQSCIKFVQGQLKNFL